MIRPLGFLGLISLMLISCTSENYNSTDFLAGEQFTDSNMRVVLIDTLTVTTSTMKFDSIVTSESSRMLIGRYRDPVFGTVISSSYIGLVPSSYTIDAEAEYDSIALHLAKDSYYYNDTLKTNTIHVKRLTKYIKGEESDNIYNTAIAEYDDTDLARYAYQPRPLTEDTLKIRLSDSLGIDFFTKFQEKEITTNDQFKDYFKGLALLPGEEDDGAIMGFSKNTDATYIRLYYSIAEENYRTQEFLDISLDQTSSPVPFFNQVKTVEPIAPIQTLVNQEIELESKAVGNLSYIQSGMGIATKIQFPFLKTVHEIKGEGTILDAVLKIRPAPNSYTDNLILRDSLSVYIVDNNNGITSQLLISDTTPVQGILNTENEEFNDIYYEISIGSYIENLLATERETEEGLILLPNNYNSTVDRFILNSMDNSQYSTVLELTYAIYDNEDN